MIRTPNHLRRVLRDPDTTDQLLWIVSMAGAICYLLVPLMAPMPDLVRGGVKALGVGALALIALRQAGRPGRSRDTLWLGIALSLSCLGDIFLAGRMRNAFIYGLGSFLLAHLIYFGLFARRWRRPLRPPMIRLGGSLALLTFSLFFSRWLAPTLQGLALPVMIYICAITLMVVAALWANFSTRLVVIGATLFMISDSILAVERFRGGMPLSGLLIWTTYYLGQYGIATGFLIDSHREAETR
jgi:uncharacterized membrane protein YhhN